MYKHEVVDTLNDLIAKLGDYASAEAKEQINEGFTELIDEAMVCPERCDDCVYLDAPSWWSQPVEPASLTPAQRRSLSVIEREILFKWQNEGENGARPATPVTDWLYLHAGE